MRDHEQGQLVSRCRLRAVSRDSLDHAWFRCDGSAGGQFAAVPNNRLGNPTRGFVLFNILLDLLEGISILWLYAAIRSQYRPGAKTAVIAALGWWFIVTLGDATWCSFGFFPPSTVIPLMIATLPALIIATLAGAKFYKE
jgi:hypothetical protein